MKKLELDRTTHEELIQHCNNNGIQFLSTAFDLDSIDLLAELDIPARPFFYPLSSLPAYEHYETGSKEKNPNAYDVSERAITLACHYNLTDEQIDFITDGIRSIL